MSMKWEITGFGPLQHLSGTYSTREVASLLIRAQEEATNWYELDQLLQGRNERDGLLSGSQLIAAIRDKK